jgi:D-hexose-6-phosphate mutarotase
LGILDLANATMKRISVRLSPRLESLLEAKISATGQTQNDIVTKALEDYLVIDKFEELRKKAIPFAEIQGMRTDSDVFREIS